MAERSSGNAGTGFATVYFTHTLDYESYSYVVNWRPYVLGSEMQLCGFRIFYEPPSTAVYLPLVSKGS